MLLNLALNHSVLFEQALSDNQPNKTEPFRGQGEKGQEIRYNASSPDELALVNGARFLGVTYLGRDSLNNNVFKIDFKG